MIKSFFLSLLLLSSCGKSVIDEAEVEVQQESFQDGTYSAVLFSVNNKISDSIRGDVKVTKYGDDFKVYVKLRNAPNVNYLQHLHTGSICPKMDQDLNSDGHLDDHEFQQQTGPPIVPLDEDLSTQEGGESLVLRGNYDYFKSTSYYLMLFDLHLPDTLLNENFVKLKKRDLPLDGRVVAIYATRVKTRFHLSTDKIPVACGILSQLSEGSATVDWQEESSSFSRPRPPQRPRPESENLPEDTNYQNETGLTGSWLARLRQRWRRWRHSRGGRDA